MCSRTPIPLSGKQLDYNCVCSCNVSVMLVSYSILLHHPGISLLTFQSVIAMLATLRSCFNTNWASSLDNHSKFGYKLLLYYNNHYFCSMLEITILY